MRFCAKHWVAAKLHRNGIARREHDAFFAKLVEQNFACYYTGSALVPGQNCSLDHRIPRSRGGQNSIDNIVWCDTRINLAKGDMTDEEFVAMCRKIAARSEGSYQW
jgi:5-methylcytosine-specific restriction endonuclease McrA